MVSPKVTRLCLPMQRLFRLSQVSAQFLYALQLHMIYCYLFVTCGHNDFNMCMLALFSNYVLLFFSPFYLYTFTYVMLKLNCLLQCLFLWNSSDLKGKFLYIIVNNKVLLCPDLTQFPLCHSSTQREKCNVPAEMYHYCYEINDFSENTLLNCNMWVSLPSRVIKNWGTCVQTHLYLGYLSFPTCSAIDGQDRCPGPVQLPPLRPALLSAAATPSDAAATAPPAATAAAAAATATDGCAGGVQWNPYSG